MKEVDIVRRVHLARAYLRNNTMRVLEDGSIWVMTRTQHQDLLAEIDLLADQLRAQERRKRDYQALSRSLDTLNLMSDR
jgi:hypothetical protein